ncbi:MULTISPECIES: hydroxyacylglutathione hydrolase [Gammaproteobacteria]|uniref:hydroxyacylglutathione hydrolase n=1 Tax=Gammaproteobacteria TaxID=1236 RepID=UPI000DCFCA3B|nr:MULTISPECIES: hydroxyacylglutathione hydrolase [Gammaproteobacteria]RTE87523.1 hydroxyacylglutathione hydrolase [Aliidiomarina sp. B3213]TCZ92692.1 hydroxyacylglutathione hydrolase [Lysobacter sp. N42]
MQIHRISAFNDNYIWLLVNDQQECIVVDPGEASGVAKFISEHGLNLKAILITHHHADHTGGVNDLATSDTLVFGPENEKIKHITHPLTEGQNADVKGFPSFQVLSCPGHTNGHIAYYAKPWLFCGDTLFAGGCGRMFEGTPTVFHGSLSKLAQLPADTQVFCAHEYTLANLNFAMQVEPNNKALQERYSCVKNMREKGIATVPSLLKNELATNPFLRTHTNTVRKAAEAHSNSNLATPIDVFAAVRQWKDTA